MKNKKEVIIKNIKNYLGLELCITFTILFSVYAFNGDIKFSFFINAFFTCLIILNLLLFIRYDETHNILYWKSEISFLLIALQIDIHSVIFINLSMSIYFKVIVCCITYITSLLLGYIYLQRKVHNKITKFETILGLVFGSILLFVGITQKYMGKVMTGRFIHSIIPRKDDSLVIWIFFLVFSSFFAFFGGVGLSADIYELKKIKHK